MFSLDSLFFKKKRKDYCNGHRSDFVYNYITSGAKTTSTGCTSFKKLIGSYWIFIGSIA